MDKPYKVKAIVRLLGAEGNVVDSYEMASYYFGKDSRLLRGTMTNGENLTLSVGQIHTLHLIEYPED